MKYDVTYKQCGHTAIVELFGKSEERRRRIAWMEENFLCPDCYEEMQKKMLKECEPVRMRYYDYKKDYSNCKTVPGSYDRIHKTIIVYVKKHDAYKLLDGLFECVKGVEK